MSEEGVPEPNNLERPPSIPASCERPFEKIVFHVDKPHLDNRTDCTPNLDSIFSQNGLDHQGGSVNDFADFASCSVQDVIPRSITNGEENFPVDDQDDDWDDFADFESSKNCVLGSDERLSVFQQSKHLDPKQENIFSEAIEKSFGKCTPFPVDDMSTLIDIFNIVEPCSLVLWHNLQRIDLQSNCIYDRFEESHSFSNLLKSLRIDQRMIVCLK